MANRRSIFDSAPAPVQESNAGFEVHLDDLTTAHAFDGWLRKHDFVCLQDILTSPQTILFLYRHQFEPSITLRLYYVVTGPDQWPYYEVRYEQGGRSRRYPDEVYRTRNEAEAMTYQQWGVQIHFTFNW